VSGLFKVLLFTSPVLAIVFFYVVSQQSKLDTEIQRESAAFERSWSEFEADFAKDKEQKQKHLSRADEADKKLKEFEQKQQEKERKLEQFEKEFEKAIQEEFNIDKNIQKKFNFKN